MLGVDHRTIIPVLRQYGDRVSALIADTLFFMRAVIQRVTYARVEVESKVVGEIGAGLLVLLGVAKDDTPNDADFLAAKIAQLRIFNDAGGKMNRSVLDAGGSILAVSQFTLYGDCRKGRRPSFDHAAPAELARQLYEHFVDSVRRQGVPIEKGVFQAHMAVSLLNDGPVTLIVESQRTS
jgi:D-tyrosyl-tRNA(Tyr) deacylase